MKQKIEGLSIYILTSKDNSFAKNTHWPQQRDVSFQANAVDVEHSSSNNESPYWKEVAELCLGAQTGNISGRRI